MTISKDLFLSILAMDSYNRGYGAGVADEREGDTNGLGDSTGIRVGSATVRSRADSGVSPEDYQAWQDAGFYALAYDIGAGGAEGLAGTTVISYRGRDNIPGSELLTIDAQIILGTSLDRGFGAAPQPWPGLEFLQ
ncbi:hypothetical protein ACSSV8_004010 [Roseovarius sp. MBR-79]|jgi:hypothetical protein